MTAPAIDMNLTDPNGTRLNFEASPDGRLIMFLTPADRRRDDVGFALDAKAQTDVVKFLRWHGVTA